MDKNSFLIYLDYEEQFNLLSNEEIGILMKAIIQYEKTKEIPDLNGMVKMAFSFIKTQLDRDREKYQVKCEKNKENARRRWSAKKANACDGIIGNANDADNDDDNEDEEDNDNDDEVIVVDTEGQLQQKFITCIGSTNINAIDECISYLDDLPYEVIVEALIKTSRIKQPNWKYAKTILDDWVSRKIDSLEKVNIEKENFKNDKQQDNSVLNNWLNKMKQREGQVDGTG